MKRLTAILLVLLILLGSAPSASANSAQSYWEGVDRAGAIITSGESPIVVEHELLTFDLQEFPQNHYTSEEDFLAYTGKVTAQYTFYNPSALTVTAKLLFPFGSTPWYGNTSVADAQKYDILIDGEAVEKKIRHCLAGEQFNLERDLPLISDTFVEDPFYHPGLTVTAYKFTVSNLDSEAYKHAVVALDLPSEFGSQRFYLQGQQYYHKQNSGSLRVAEKVQNGEGFYLYVLGEPLTAIPSFKFYQNGGAKDGEEITGTVNHTYTETLTFRELVCRNWSEDTGVAEVDWYNAVVADINSNSFSKNNPTVFTPDQPPTFTARLMRWYAYEITLEPGQQIVNTVTAPIYPSIDTDYKPAVYGYTYLLSPAKTWKSFGPLEIVVNTPYYITESSLKDFEKTDTGYKLTLPGLPDEELTFQLSTSENPEAPKSNIFVDFLFIFAFIISYIGYLFESLFETIAGFFTF